VLYGCHHHTASELWQVGKKHCWLFDQVMPAPSVPISPFVGQEIGLIEGLLSDWIENLNWLICLGILTRGHHSQPSHKLVHIERRFRVAEPASAMLMVTPTTPTTGVSGNQHLDPRRRLIEKV